LDGADVFDVTVSSDQNKVMASGVDSKLVSIERIPSSDPRDSKWVLAHQQRSHTHDVNSLATVFLGGNELLCSGGVDTKVCSYLVRNMREHRAQLAYKFPTKAPIVLSKGPRLLSIMRADKIDFYQLARLTAPLQNTTTPLPQDEERAHIGSIAISSNYNLISFDVSDDGKFLAVSHTAGLLMFSLKMVETHTGQGSQLTNVIVPKKVELPSAIITPCSALKFVSSKMLVCATTRGFVNMVRIDSEGETFSATLEHTFNKDETRESANTNFPITELSVSPDGLWLATGSNDYGKGCINVFNIATEYRHWWALPCTETSYSCMKFFGDGRLDPALAVACHKGVVYIFDIKEKRMSDWSEDIGFPASRMLPKELALVSGCPENLAYNNATPDKFIMGGPSWFCSIDLSSPVPLRSKPYPLDHFKARTWQPKIDYTHSKPEIKRRDDLNKNFTICLRYAGIIFQDFLGDNEMVIVEQPWLSIVNALPDALERPRYGGY